MGIKKITCPYDNLPSKSFFPQLANTNGDLFLAPEEDGLKIDFKESWAHIRKSNTEMILRIYTEAKTENKAKSLSKEIVEKIMKI